MGLQPQAFKPEVLEPRPHKSHRTEDKTPRLLVKAALNIPEYPMKLTPESSDISQISGFVVGSVGSAHPQVWPYVSLSFLLKLTAAAAAAAKSLQLCLTVQHQRREPNRLPYPWDSPGKNTGVGCHCLLQCMKVKSKSEVAQSCLTPSDPMDCSPPGSSVHGIFQARVVEWVAIAFFA